MVPEDLRPWPQGSRALGPQAGEALDFLALAHGHMGPSWFLVCAKVRGTQVGATELKPHMFAISSLRFVPLSSMMCYSTCKEYFLANGGVLSVYVILCAALGI